MTRNVDVLNAQEAAQLLSAHVETIRRMARRGAVPAYKIGKDWRFRKEALLLWAESSPGLRKTAQIMVIDDEAGVRKLISRHLKNAGYRVISAAQAQEGLLLIQQDAIDLVLLDLHMPLMNGPEFIRELRMTHPDLPIIIVTGYPDSNLMMEAYRYGPLTLIPKPVEKKSLISAVNMTLEGSMSDRDGG